MRKSTSIGVSVGLFALGFAVFEAGRTRNLDAQLKTASDDARRLEKRAFAAETRNGALQRQMEQLRAETDSLRQRLDEISAATTALGRPGLAGPERGQMAVATAPNDAEPVPASQVAAIRQITVISPEELARRVEAARQRAPESLTPVAPGDLASMPSAYEWGTGDSRRMWRLVDQNTYQEVYPDGSYSVIPILGRAVVNGMQGVIATKDDGALDVFIPDKGGRMVHMIRPANSQARWMDYVPMEKVE